MSDGSLTIFVTRPISALFLGLTMVSLFVPILLRRKKIEPQEE
jgi:TctA family transporter